MSLPHGEVFSDHRATVSLSRSLRLGLAVRSPRLGPLRFGLVAESGSKASLRSHHRVTGATNPIPGYRYFGLGLEGSAERADRWGFVRFEAGPLLNGYSGDKGFACSADVSPTSDMCNAAAQASSRLEGSGVLVGVTRGGVPGLRRMGIAIDDRITWHDARPRHDVQLGFVVQLREP